MSTTVTSGSAVETRDVAAGIARRAGAGDVYGLVGGLGTGKTEFVRGFVAALNPDAPVTSPSFSLLNIYDTPGFPVYHFDFYRIASRRELAEIGLDDYVNGDGVCLVEWADMFPEALPKGSITVTFEDRGESVHRITVEDAAENPS
jgi:tRNA threonylcarbamoyladenosine biosynthesis protein TsaE